MKKMKVNTLAAVMASHLAIFATAGDLFAQHQLPIGFDSITFELNFDNGVAMAEISSGRAKLINTLGVLKYAKGLKGKALVCGEGGGKLLYHLKGNIDFSSPGSVVFWVKPIEWEKAAELPRVFFWGVESSKGFLGVQIANGPKKSSPLQRDLRCLLLYFKSIPDSTLSIKGFGRGERRKWRMITFEWDENRVFLSIDGKPPAMKTLHGKLNSKAFSSHAFSIGSHVHAKYMLDEFKIYSRKLSDNELFKIYSSYKQR
jgi:hypothetical protein